MDGTTPDWSSLPLHLLALIAGRLPARIDNLRFRAVCNSFRSSVLPPPKSFSPYSDLDCYYQMCGQFHFLVVEYTFYAIESIFKTTNANGSTRTPLVKVEDSNSGRVRLQNPFSSLRCENTSGSLNLLDYRVEEISKGYRLELAKDKQRRFKEVVFSEKVVVSTDDEFAMLAPVFQHLVGWRCGNKKGEEIDVERDFVVNDITYHKKKFYVSSSDGSTIAVDPKSFKVTEVAAPLQEMNRLGGMSLISSAKDLLLIHRHRRDRKGNSEINTCPVCLDIFKLDEEKREWIKVKDELEDRFLFLGWDWSFSVSAEEFCGWKRNCVYLAEGGRAAIFNLENDTCDWLSDSPGNSGWI